MEIDQPSDAINNVDVSDLNQTQIPDCAPRWLRLRGLKEGTTKEDIMEHLVWYGPMIWKQRKSSRIIIASEVAFVEFDDHSQAEELRSKTHDTMLHDSKLSASVEQEWFVRSPEQRGADRRGSTKTVAIHSVPDACSDDEICGLCTQHGTVFQWNSRLVSRTNPHRTVVVEMGSEREARYVYDALHGHLLQGIPLQTEFPELDGPVGQEERKKKFEMEMKERIMKERHEKTQERMQEMERRKQERYERLTQGAEEMRAQCGLSESVCDADWKGYFERAANATAEQRVKDEEEEKYHEGIRAEREEAERQRREEREIKERAKLVREQAEREEKMKRKEKESEELAKMRDTLRSMRCDQCLGIGHWTEECPAPTQNRLLRKYVPMSLNDLYDDDVVRVEFNRYLRRKKMGKDKKKETQMKAEENAAWREGQTKEDAADAKIRARRARLLALQGGGAKKFLGVKKPKVERQKRGLLAAHINARGSFGIKFA